MLISGSPVSGPFSKLELIDLLSSSISSKIFCETVISRFSSVHQKMSTSENKPHSSATHCCILHDFYKSASKTPEKIAVIHAHGGAQLSGLSGDDNRDEQFQRLVEERTISNNPPVYEGDECFTFAEIVAAVENLSRRIRNVISGGDDPALVRPTLGNLWLKS